MVNFKEEIIKANLKSIENKIPKGDKLNQDSLISTLQQEQVQKRIKDLLGELEIDENYSCFDTEIIEELENKIEDTNIELSKEQKRIIKRIKKIIELNIQNLSGQLKRGRINDMNFDNTIEIAKNKTLHLLLKNDYNINELNYLLSQKLDKELYSKVFDFIVKSKNKIDSEIYIDLFKKLLSNPGVNKKYIEDFFLNKNNIDYIEEKGEIIDSGILDKREIIELFFTEGNTYLIGKILRNEKYVGEEIIVILLNKVVDNYTKNYNIVKNLLLYNFYYNGNYKKIELSNSTNDFIYYLFKEDEDFKGYLN